MTSVDFPIPGSPPIKTREPGTSPPPNTRFSSSSCILMRGSSSASISLRITGFAFCVSMPDTGRRLVVSFRTISSTYVFHSPHDGHLPTHFGDSCPQLLHTYTVFSFAIFLIIQVKVALLIRFFGKSRYKYLKAQNKYALILIQL